MAFAQEQFTGQIKGTVITEVLETPVEGASVDIEAGGNLKLGAAVTDAAGGFQIDLAKLFNHLTLKGRTIIFKFTKQGYAENVTHWECKSVAPRDYYHLRIKLVPLHGSSALTAEEQKKLDPHVSSRRGHTLFLLPYEITSTSGSNYVINIKNLAITLMRAINTHVTGLPMASSRGVVKPFIDISIKPIEVQVEATNTEKIRRYGMHLNALAMVSGYGNVERGESGKDMAHITSHYCTILSFPEFPSTILAIDDTAPAELLNSIKLSENLSRVWRSYTLLAVCLNEFEQAKQVEAKPDRERRLKNVRTYLLNELADLGADEQLRMSEIEKLLELVDQELK
jgi:hypothetical protein